ncbi:MAG: exo-alpha-sialidase [Oligosphaeraceae bacterium]|nr:exo-alpha-sialidase [Oligosphaeraceae bacterium]
MSYQPVFALISILLLGISTLLHAEPILYIKQNFDDTTVFNPGLMQENLGAADQPPGAWKHQGHNAGLELVTSPVASTPHALKITRQETGGTNLTFFKATAIPSQHDFSIRFALYLPEKGSLAVWFTNDGSLPFGGFRFVADGELSGYVGTQKAFIWKPSRGITVPTKKFFTVSIQFNAGAKRYAATLLDESGEVLALSRKYPFLGDDQFKAIKFIDCMPAGTTAYVDDLEITWDSEVSKGRVLPRGPVSEVLSEPMPGLTVTRGSMRLGPIEERKQPRNDKLRYAVIMPFQVGPRTAGAFVNRAIYESYWNYDAEDGNDIFLFDDLNRISESKPFKLNRSGVQPDAKYNNTPRQFIRFPVNGGFVPYGALINGTPHPHAGTGYALGQVVTFPAGPNGTFSYETSPINGETDFFQLSYDGKELKVVSHQILDDLLPVPNSPWKIRNIGMTTAIPDGTDLLQPCQADSGSGASYRQASGVSRWSYSNGGWRPMDFTPIAISSEEEEHTFYEPSLVRDRSGRLIFATRDDGRQNKERPAWGNDIKQDINVWRSPDNGKTWEHIVYVEQLRTGPMALGRTADATLFVMGNPILEGKPGHLMRNVLYMWPINDMQNGLMKPLVVCDAVEQFGKGYNNSWNVDHPNGTVLRLADGKEHGVIAYRVRDPHFVSGFKRDDPRTIVSEPSPQAGAYIEEVSHPGTAVPIWEFKD